MANAWTVGTFGWYAEDKSLPNAVLVGSFGWFTTLLTISDTIGHRVAAIIGSLRRR